MAQTVWSCFQCPSPASSSGQPVDVAASGLRHMDEHGGAQPGHQSAHKDPRGRLWIGLSGGNSPFPLQDPSRSHVPSHP